MCPICKPKSQTYKYGHSLVIIIWYWAYIESVLIFDFPLFFQKHHLLQKHQISDEDTKRVKEYSDAITGQRLSPEEVTRREHLEATQSKRVTAYQCPKCDKNSKGYATFSSLVRFSFPPLNVIVVKQSIDTAKKNE